MIRKVPLEVRRHDELAVGAELFAGFTGSHFSGGQWWSACSAGRSDLRGERFVYLKGADPTSCDRGQPAEPRTWAPAAHVDPGSGEGIGRICTVASRRDTG